MISEVGRKKLPSEILLENIDIVSVIEKYVNVIKKGNTYKCLCPFHNDTNPSLSIKKDKQFFNCFVCGAKGNMIEFVRRYKNITFKEAMKLIADQFNIDINLKTYVDKNQKMYDLNQKVAFIYHRTLFNKENKSVLDYLYSRGLTDEIIKELEIGYAPVDNPNGEKNKYLLTLLTNENNIYKNQNIDVYSHQEIVKAGLAATQEDGKSYDYFRNRIIFPIKDEYNNVVGFSGRALDDNQKAKYLVSPSSDWFKKDSIFYNLNNANLDNYENVYIVEGYFDLITFKLLGINNVISSMGVSISDKQLDVIRKYKSIETLNIGFDNDKAGFNGFMNLLNNGINQYKWNINCCVFGSNLSIINGDKNWIDKIKDWNDVYKIICDRNNNENRITDIWLKPNIISPIEYIVKGLDKWFDKTDKISFARKIINIIIKFNLYDPITFPKDSMVIQDYTGIKPSDIEKALNIKYERTLKELSNQLKILNKVIKNKKEYI